MAAGELSRGERCGSLLRDSDSQRAGARFICCSERSLFGGFTRFRIQSGRSDFVPPDRPEPALRAILFPVLCCYVSLLELPKNFNLIRCGLLLSTLLKDQHFQNALQ